jgi:hypothetical protein
VEFRGRRGLELRTEGAGAMRVSIGRYSDEADVERLKRLTEAIRLAA